MKPLVPLSTAAILTGTAVLYACQDTTETTQPSQASALVSYRLTVSGVGTGRGRVTSSPAGITCDITAGTKTGTCSALFPGGTTVKLTAKATSPDAFGAWSGSCTGTGVLCSVSMGTNRAVSAEFRKGPFTISISSGSSGGSGKVTSQSATGLPIDCTITNGTLSGACSRSYAGHTALTLTATPAAGFVFEGWPERGCGTGNCLVRVTSTRTIPAEFSDAPTSNAATEGRWDRPFTTPIVVIHSHQLSNGKVLMWGDTGDAQLWSPWTGGFTAASKAYRIFCSGHSFLPDGRLLIVGGTSPETRGLRQATIFNPATNSWSNTPLMAKGRYYPTLTTLPNGRLLAMSGHDTTLAPVLIPEVWNGTSWTKLSTAPLSIPNPYYPFMFVAPNGKVFYAGFTQPSRYLDVTGTGQWTTVGNRVVADRVLGSAVMYAPGKVLYVGGGNGQPWDGPPTASAEVIDLNQPAPSWRLTGSMAFPRKQLNTTILADGSVLVTGGTTGAGSNNQSGAVHQAELWNPATGTWKTMAAEYHNRTYHSTAILLPSGRVLSSGGGEGGGISYVNSEFTAQVYSPPYLFKADGSLAARPTITSAPGTLAYGQTFTVQTPNAASVQRGNLIRLSSVTHGFNMSQALYPLTFRATSSSSLNAVAPPNPNLAPPGYYMLFLLNDAGVPSAAKFVRLGG